MSSKAKRGASFDSCCARIKRFFKMQQQDMAPIILDTTEQSSKMRKICRRRATRKQFAEIESRSYITTRDDSGKEGRRYEKADKDQGDKSEGS